MQQWKPILLVEDDSVDAMTVRRAFEQLEVPKSLVHVANGEEALEYLTNENNEFPCVILLDLNMPKMNGIEFLKIAKADDMLRRIPIVVLTTSKEERDIVDSFNLSVAGYIIKPVDYENFLDKIGTIYQYWSLSKIPSKTPNEPK